MRPTRFRGLSVLETKSMSNGCRIVGSASQIRRPATSTPGMVSAALRRTAPCPFRPLARVQTPLGTPAPLDRLLPIQDRTLDSRERLMVKPPKLGVT
jgi:hypothetical protein